MKPKSQHQALIQLLSKGWADPIKGFAASGTLKFSTRVKELSEYFTIEYRKVNKKSRYGYPCCYNECRIIKDKYYQQGLKAFGL